MSPMSDPRFARFVDGGKVHVLSDRLHTVSDTLGEPPTGSLGEWLLARQWALCGAMGGAGTLHDVSYFPDRDLCAHCYQAWPGDTNDLFNHPT